MMTTLKRLPGGCQKAATENRFKSKRNFRNDYKKLGASLLPQSNLKANSIQLHSTILKVDCLNYVLFPLFSLRGAAAPWARATNNVKKPQSQMWESCRKLDLRFL